MTSSGAWWASSVRTSGTCAFSSESGQRSSIAWLARSQVVPTPLELGGASTTLRSESGRCEILGANSTSSLLRSSNSTSFGIGLWSASNRPVTRAIWATGNDGPRNSSTPASSSTYLTLISLSGSVSVRAASTFARAASSSASGRPVPTARISKTSTRTPSTSLPANSSASSNRIEVATCPMAMQRRWLAASGLSLSSRLRPFSTEATAFPSALRALALVLSTDQTRHSFSGCRVWPIIAIRRNAGQWDAVVSSKPLALVSKANTRPVRPGSPSPAWTRPNASSNSFLPASTNWASHSAFGGASGVIATTALAGAGLWTQPAITADPVLW